MKIVPKFIIKNNKSGEEFKALDVYPTFPVYNGWGPRRQIKIVYTDDIERVKCVLNYDVINKYNNKQIIYDLNDSFDVYSIEEDNTIKKVVELRALFAQSIDPDYCTINGVFEWEYFEMDSRIGISWYGNYKITEKYAETLRPRFI